MVGPVPSPLGDCVGSLNGALGTGQVLGHENVEDLGLLQDRVLTLGLLPGDILA